MLIFDIETATTGKPDTNTDKLKFIGAYSYNLNKYFFYYKSKESFGSK